MKRQAVLDIDLGVDALLPFIQMGQPEGARAWNELVVNLWRSKLLANVWHEHEPEPILVIGVDLSGGDLSHRGLDGYDLSHCWLEGVNFNGSTMQGTLIGCCPRAKFIGSDMLGATISGDISGVDFTGANLQGTRWEDCVYDEDDPPRGLPDNLLKRCRSVPPESPKEPLKRLHTVPIAVRARLLLPRTSRPPRSSNEIRDDSGAEP